MKLIERIFKRKNNKVTSPFGMRWHPIKKKWMMHNGTDYGTGKQNWEVFAIEEGTIVACGYTNEVGNFVKINFNRINIQLWFFHLKEYYVYKNQKVNENTLIGLVGTTGSSTSEHLHLGLKFISNGQFFDPELFDYQEHYINGKWNEQFTRDLQTYFGTTVDGIISGQLGQRKNISKVQYGLKGSQMVKALQKALGHIQSGQLDKSTIVALQRALGLVPDGFISETSNTVRILQTRLSEGWLL